MMKRLHRFSLAGRPGGSIAATLLVREGFDVTLVERGAFPRYHIGESLALVPGN